MSIMIKSNFSDYLVTRSRDLGLDSDKRSNSDTPKGLVHEMPILGNFPNKYDEVGLIEAFRC